MPQNAPSSNITVQLVQGENPSQFTAYNFVEEKMPEQSQASDFVSQTEFDEVKNQLQQISALLQTLLQGVNNNAIQQGANVSS